MKKALRIIGFVVLGIVAIVAILLSYVAIAGVPSYSQEDVTVNIEYTPERVQEGHRIVASMCNNCHMNSETGKLTGSRMLDLPESFGKAWSQNITGHKSDGIGNWTDAQLVYFLRTNIKPDGTFVPFMPSMTHFSDEDMFSLVSFLRSDHPWVAPTPGRQPKNEYTLLSKILGNTVFKPMDYPEGPVASPDTNNLVEYGRYLVVAKWDCYNCHSADFASNNIKYPEKSKGFMGGGNKLLNEEGNEIFSANLTFDKSGLEGWTLEDFKSTVRTGKSPNGMLRYPMPPFPSLNDRELEAMYAYLKSIPKIENEVNRTRGAVTASK